ncbi:filamentous hemagglutinin N-terminal domain-containing protein [Limnobacter humi]|uniref:Filamentous hemagglutinin N-terminal domain-containing protein n=1 Tax=Limnobacter humi TaxID=1778671 RepID=A0ABT1WD56_9BURK|nr:filamentous hemagglutinin N-terminal domain-containing protein [Limnobacter humi]
MRAFKLKPLAAAVLWICSGAALALPEFQANPGGGVTLDTSVNKTLVVNQTSNTPVATVLWKNFSVGSGETVQFVQPDSHAVLLNRVTGREGSDILGQLKSNGRLFLINPNGIVFGTNAQVNVGALVASTLDLQGPVKQGAVPLAADKNTGDIQLNGVIEGQQLAFIAPSISHAGTLRATSGGQVDFLAASAVTANVQGDFIAFQVDAGHEQALIQQLGQINAPDGTVILVARSTGSGNPSVLNTGGLVQAQSLIAQGDQVVLAGTVDGALSVRADHVSQAQAVNVRGSADLVANMLTLDHAQNQFQGVVRIAAGDAQLKTQGDVQLAGTADHLMVSAQHLQIAQSGMRVNRDAVFIATGVAQSSSGSTTLSVGGDLTVSADQVGLRNTKNAVSGTINLTAHEADLAVTGTLRLLNPAVRGALTMQADQVQVVAKDALQLGVQADSLTMQSTGAVHLNASALGSLTVKTSQGIDQHGALQVSGNSDLQADSIVLQDRSNQWLGNVQLQAQEARIDSAASYSITGSTDSLDAHSGKTLTVGAAGLSTQGETSLVAQRLAQDGALMVAGPLHLQAAQVDLFNAKNQLTGPVSVDAGTLALAAKSDLILSGQSDAWTVQTPGTVTQSGAIRSAGPADFNGRSIELTHTDNHWGGTVAVRAANVQLTGDERITLGQSQVTGTLAVNAPQSIEQVGALKVDGPSQFEARNIDLRHGENLLGSTVTVHGNTAALHSQRSLTVLGQVDALTLSTADQATLATGPLQTLDVTASSIVQAAPVVVEDRVHLKANTVTLADTHNDFGGVVDVTAEQLQISDQNNLVLQTQAKTVEVRGQSVTLTARGDVDLRSTQVGGLNARTDGVLTLHSDGLQTAVLDAHGIVFDSVGGMDDLTAKADFMSQKNALTVNNATLNAALVNLSNHQNDFKQTVTVSNPAGGQSVATLSDRNDLQVQGTDLTLGGQIGGALVVHADRLTLAGSTVQGAVDLFADRVEQTSTPGDVVHWGNARIQASQIDLDHAQNAIQGDLTLVGNGVASITNRPSLTVDTTSWSGPLSVHTQGDARLTSNALTLGDTVVQGFLDIQAQSVSQVGSLEVSGQTAIAALGGQVELTGPNNQFGSSVSVVANRLDLKARGDLNLAQLTLDAGGTVEVERKLLLNGVVELGAGQLDFVARGIPKPLSSADVALKLPASLDVYSAKEAVEPTTGLGRIEIAAPMIEQTGGSIRTQAVSRLNFSSLGNGSVFLNQQNQVEGTLGVLAGSASSQAYTYRADQGLSLVSVQNAAPLVVGGGGIEGDMVAIASAGLRTEAGRQIRARLPYNDTAAGERASFPGLTLSIPSTQGSRVGDSQVYPFGAGGVGANAGGGAIAVAVGETTRKGLGGYVTVLPVDGAKQLPGQVVFLSGPDNPGVYAFFYDGARDLTRIPVSYNGSLLLSPQEAAALTSAQGALVLARQEQTMSVVRTENVASRVINGVVVEVGPGRPATEGTGELMRPASCEGGDGHLTCSP